MRFREGHAQFWGDLAFTAEAQSARREKLKHLCVLGVSAARVSYNTFKWRIPSRSYTNVDRTQGRAWPTAES
jgi:hypothetical protein